MPPPYGALGLQGILPLADILGTKDAGCLPKPFRIESNRIQRLWDNQIGSFLQVVQWKPATGGPLETTSFLE